MAKQMPKGAAGDRHQANREISGARRRHPLLMRMVRNKAVAKLQKDRGLSFFEARKMVDEVTDEEIMDAAASMRMDAPQGAGFFDWIKDHLPQIMELVKLILMLVGTFAEPTPEDDNQEDDE